MFQITGLHPRQGAHSPWDVSSQRHMTPPLLKSFRKCLQHAFEMLYTEFASILVLGKTFLSQLKVTLPLFITHHCSLHITNVDILMSILLMSIFLSCVCVCVRMCRRVVYKLTSIILTGIICKLLFSLIFTWRYVLDILLFQVMKVYYDILVYAGKSIISLFIWLLSYWATCINYPTSYSFPMLY